MATVASSRTKIEDEKIDVETVSSDDEEHVHDEHCQHSTSSRTIGRKERAARKELSKAGNLKLLPHIKRVTFKRHNGPVFAISNAEVYLDSTSGSYIVYGQPMVETGGLGAQAAQRMAAEQAASDMTMPSSKITVQDDDEQDADGADIDNKEQEEGLDISGLDEKDIAIVMDQAHVSRAKAIRALRANGNDIVNTIMELTM